MESNNTVSLVQCKNGYKNGITIENLAGFMSWMFSLPNLNGYVYYTNKLSKNVKCLPKNDRINYIKILYEENKNIIKENKIFKPFDYQLEATNKCLKYFEINNQGILSMPCGTGKTFTSYLISTNYKQIIIFSPLKQFAKQNLDKYIEYGYKYNNLLVSSDGERNIDIINTFISSNENYLISATFDSIDVLNFSNIPFIIIDEFHNLSKNNVTNKNDNFYKWRRIFFIIKINLYING